MNFDPHYTLRLPGLIAQVSATEQNLTTELSSGLRITQLSDDPVAAAGEVAVAASASRLDSFVKSSTAEQSRMQVADHALGEVVAQVTSAIGLAVNAGNGTLNAAEIKAIEAQVAGVRDSIVALGNTSYEGQYVFGGSQGGVRPFSLDTTADPAVASYHGDAALQAALMPEGETMAISVPGSSVFQAGGADLLGALNLLVSHLGAAAGGGGSTASIQADAAALTAALGAVTGQRAVLDSALSRLSSATTYASTQKAVYTAQESALIGADPATVATELKSAEVQQQALLAVMAALDGQQNLFAYLK